MTELFQTNVDVIQSRWPQAAMVLKQQNIDSLDAALVTGSNQTISINGVQLSSRHDRVAETQLFLSTLPNDIKHATLYGFGMGDIPSIALEEGRLDQLDICILNPTIFALVLSYTDQTAWLSHPGVSLELQPKQNRLRKPYLVVPADLELISDENARLRDLLMYELNLNYANSSHKNDNPAIMQRFEDNRTFMQQDPDVSALKNTVASTSAVVIGSGPSLEQQYEKLAALCLRSERPIIIAVDTALRGLLHHNITPDIVVSIDGLVSFQLPLEKTDAIKLVYFPRVRTENIQEWRGSRYNALGDTQLYDNLATQFPEKTRLYANGSVLHPAIDIAVLLGCQDIYLCGSDFCFCGNKSHAFWDEYAVKDKNISYWMSLEQKNVQSAVHWVINGYGEKVATNLNFRSFLRSLELYLEKHPTTRFHQCSKDSAKVIGADFRELP
ncbi:hypothetical protein HR45_15465 [Shewanella mangrovi]|uniref:6-hydroxymethylpterin diphosphokinase MptE-like domain-containing protein n=1 Tax=Shewanella mangrovi TaxID=1515746 RepID=A0A094J9E2_9GAMM|nr:6-hydroxymethylpterin diphosphokinase MptE-like protein [Shewanella mangrovi]KFZ36535.1 hypothetical protein HR45_15465 [Shewanella mangrovi]